MQCLISSWKMIFNQASGMLKLVACMLILTFIIWSIPGGSHDVYGSDTATSFTSQSTLDTAVTGLQSQINIHSAQIINLQTAVEAALNQTSTFVGVLQSQLTTESTRIDGLQTQVVRFKNFCSI